MGNGSAVSAPSPKGRRSLSRFVQRRVERLEGGSQKLLAPVTTLAFVAVGLTFWQLGSTLEWWNPGIIPAPSHVVDAMGTAFAAPEFRDDLRTTLVEIGASFAGATLSGFTLGFVFWKLPYVGRAFEPYIVSFYTIPLIVFYPIFLVIIGLDSWPIILLASIMGGIPMTLSTWVGLSSIPDVYYKLGRSLRCSERQFTRLIAVPAAAPFISSGARIAAVYAVIGPVAMEFMFASSGLGFRVKYFYDIFQIPQMFAYIVLIFALALLLVFTIRMVERRLTAHRAEVGALHGA